ncbi:MAG: hypothetical protein HYR72_12965 [Deltaproteobacteria bacterium]|nr:hypothetical protein [Deltaproteobacteria bacterium]MBI3390468.1 hypothetical protein [Deltaproteobacteria bacterium]
MLVACVTALAVHAHGVMFPVEALIMVSNGRYVRDEEKFKRYAYAALASRFQNNRASFEHFYSSLPSAATKDEFLRVTSFYLFLVKQGDWRVAVEGSDPVIDYLTNTFKLVAFFSLVESLSDEGHQDFYEWLCGEDPERTFPVGDPAALRTLYERYKASYGSVRRCIAFFDRLPQPRKEALCNAIHLDGIPVSSIKKVAEFLYDLRSKFVHEGRLALQVSDTSVFSQRKEKVVRTELTITGLLEAFEEGVLAYFGDGT